MNLQKASPHELQVESFWESIICLSMRGIELADFMCRDSMDMQYMIIQKYLSKSQNSKLVSLYDNATFIFKCFVTYNTPST